MAVDLGATEPITLCIKKGYENSPIFVESETCVDRGAGL